MHQSVLVVLGKQASLQDAFYSIADALEPFSCEADVDPYLVSCDHKAAVEFYKSNNSASDPMPARSKKQEYRLWVARAVGEYETGNPEDGVYDEVSKTYAYTSTYNPNAEWDWWVLGGRWGGFFLPKPEVKVVTDADESGDALARDFTQAGYADLVRAGDIDVEAMVQQQARVSSLWFDQMEYATLKAGVLPSLERGGQWQQTVNKACPGDMFGPHPFDRFHLGSTGRQGYLVQENQWVLSTASVVMDGVWDSDPQQSSSDLIQSLDKDVWLALVDCHF